MVENDVRALTLAERWFGEGHGAASFAMVTIGAGVGCGLFVNDDVVAGAHGVSGEIGHLPLVDDGPVCTCGRWGCVETVASSAAILRDAREAAARPDLTMREAVERAHAGDARCGRCSTVPGT